MDDTLRPFRTSDAEALAALTLAAIRVTGLRGYAPEQVAAWAARHPGPERFISSAAKGDNILVAVDADDTPIAYLLTEPDGHCDMLYCHPDHSGRGLAAALLAETESWARAAQIARLFTEASELARPVFERAGFAVLHRRDFTIGPPEAPVAIHNYAMEKRLR
jgi:putative acetyltransferase